MPLIRQALVVMLLALSGVLLTQLPAHACTCTQQTFADQIQAADVVFTGSVSTISPPSEGTVTYDVAADRIFKGGLGGSVVTIHSPAKTGACGLGELPADRPYVFLVARSGTAYTAESCGGTAPVSAKMNERVGRLLGQGEPVASTTAPESATYTKVEQAAPATLARLAAPGAALVIIGLLGLMVVRRLGRRA
ncbi:hypothetical protein [Nocardioides sp. InS609-2]|uniref:hypothetical protein n=1 Tax=Nocardioides sp. InS609-2 TaxID=2760705 RepID=UPI0020BF9BBF|nr:hypothetical protein [Nocardioides sp. InS609-2]